MVGLFGGAFDPIHLGHLHHAQHILRECALDKIIFIPTGIPAHKEELFFSHKQRLTMLKLATKDTAEFEISDFEFNGKISYTIDTLKHFKNQYDEIQFLMGSDSFMDLDTWDDYEIFAQLCNIIIFLREHNAHHIDKCYNFKRVWDSQALHNEVGKVYISTATGIDISATQIRKYIKAQQDYQHLVPKAIHTILYEYAK